MELKGTGMNIGQSSFAESSDATAGLISLPADYLFVLRPKTSGLRRAKEQRV
jgi:hypothetical protein